MTDQKRWSPRRFWRYATVFTVLFVVAHLAGFREDTSVLAGTHSGDASDKYWGVVYLILYVIWVCIVPILTIAGGLLWGGGRIFGGDNQDPDTGPSAFDVTAS